MKPHELRRQMKGIIIEMAEFWGVSLEATVTELKEMVDDAAGEVESEARPCTHRYYGCDCIVPGVVRAGHV